MTHLRSLSSVEEMRLFWGFLVQPFAAAVLGFVSFPLIEWSGNALEGRGSSYSIGGETSIAFSAALAALFVTVGGALPLVSWLLKRGPLTLKAILSWGALLGNLPFALIAPFAALTSSGREGSWFWPMGAVRALTIGAAFGLVGATLFWAISIRGTAMERPTRSA